MPAIGLALSRAHSKNIDRYHRLLKTHLTDVERNYIELRLSVEEAALKALDAPRQYPPMLTVVARLKPNSG